MNPSSETGPAISISAHDLVRLGNEAINFGQVIRDRATPGTRQNIPAALIARDRLRALIGGLPQSDTLGQSS